jgi:hypothetical protein
MRSEHKQFSRGCAARNERMRRRLLRECGLLKRLPCYPEYLASAVGFCQAYAASYFAKAVAGYGPVVPR